MCGRSPHSSRDAQPRTALAQSRDAQPLRVRAAPGASISRSSTNSNTRSKPCKSRKREWEFWEVGSMVGYGRVVGVSGFVGQHAVPNKKVQTGEIFFYGDDG